MRKYAWIILATACFCFMGGCASKQVAEKDSDNEKWGESYIVSEETNKKLYLLEGDKETIELSEGGCVIDGPEMRYGQAACITADVEIAVSKASEEIKYITVKELKNFQSMKMSEIAEILKPAEAQKGIVTKEHFLTYTDGEETYYIARDFPCVDIMKGDSSYISYTYAILANHTDPLEAFWISLSVGYRQKGIIDPEYTENEILNLSDAELFYLGLLESDRRLASVAEYVSFEDMVLEEGFRYVGFAAEDPAGNEAEARAKAEKEWEKYSKHDYYNIYLLAETDEYWFFTNGWGTVPGEKREYVVVYKKDYYETKDDWPAFELTEDFVRNYMAYTYPESTWNAVYIGEFIVPDQDDLIFRRYRVQGHFQDVEGVSDATLDCDEWRFYSDGTVEYVGFMPEREAQSGFDDLR